jgi:hypothetical protein
MDRQIILDCQTKNQAPHCEDCIAYKTCKARSSDDGERGISVANTETVGVWKKWQIRKSLTT